MSEFGNFLTALGPSEIADEKRDARTGPQFPNLTNRVDSLVKKRANQQRHIEKVQKAFYADKSLLHNLALTVQKNHLRPTVSLASLLAIMKRIEPLVGLSGVGVRKPLVLKKALSEDADNE